MKTLFKYSIFSLLILSGCSTIKENNVYKGNYKGDKITISFTSTKEGYLTVNDKDSIPFSYKIEKNKIERQSDNQGMKKLNYYVYRFSLDAQYKLDFPLGFYEIGQKRGRVLQVNDSLTFIKQEIKK